MNMMRNRYKSVSWITIIDDNSYVDG